MERTDELLWNRPVPTLLAAAALRSQWRCEENVVAFLVEQMVSTRTVTVTSCVTVWGGSERADVLLVDQLVPTSLVVTLKSQW